jgi:hypothetical protein
MRKSVRINARTGSINMEQASDELRQIYRSRICPD